MLMCPVAFYGCETSILRREEKDKLEVLEMWQWRKLEKLNWSDRISNDVILTMVNESRCTQKLYANERKSRIGHVLKEIRLLRDVLKGRMLGKGLVGRPRGEKCWMILWLFRLKDRRKRKNSCSGN